MMNIEIIYKNNDNFVMMITGINLTDKQCYNYIARIKGKLSESYGKGSITFIFDKKIINGALKVLIPNGYYDYVCDIKHIFEEVYDSMER